MLDKIRNFLARLFPPELTAYIPGAKLVAGVILAITAALGFGPDATLDLPAVGEVDVATLALAVGVYLFPSSTTKIEIEAHRE